MLLVHARSETLYCVQIEGAADEGGRGQSIWDTFSHKMGKTHNGDTGDVAVDFYHRFESDIQMMQSIGVKMFRFSISWSRVLPQGTGKVNPVYLDWVALSLQSQQSIMVGAEIETKQNDVPCPSDRRWLGQTSLACHACIALCRQTCQSECLLGKEDEDESILK